MSQTGSSLESVDALTMEDRTMTISLECPWCDGHVALDDEADLVTCDACGVVAHLAADEPAVLAAAA